MLFNSLHFLIFLPLVVILYYIIPGKFRWIFLLAASYYFYMCWKLEYIVLIIVSTLIDYYAGLKMSKYENDKKKKKKFLYLSLFSNLGILFAFKYFNFFSDSAKIVLENFNVFYDTPVLHVLLPVGISFYTFQTLSYSIEVYYGTQKAERHLGYFALYVSYFPQLVAGPIERYSNLGEQLKHIQIFSYNNLINGLRLILFGLFIKMAIADNIAQYVDEIYANPLNYNSLSVVLGLVFYSAQIYSDFYGYSVIAIGSALIMGVKIMDNFKTPYLSKNIAEFWSRWHISLSTWFRDYLYIPLGGNRVSSSRWSINIFIVFAVSGLWHGANWTFVIWGALHGFLYLSEISIVRILKIKFKENINFINVLRIIKNFVLVTLIWVFFRSENLDKVANIFKSLFFNLNVQDNFNVDIKVYILFGFFILTDILLYKKRYDKWCETNIFAIRWISYAILIFCILALSGVNHKPFIYFQF